MPRSDKVKSGRRNGRLRTRYARFCHRVVFQRVGSAGFFRLSAGNNSFPGFDNQIQPNTRSLKRCASVSAGLVDSGRPRSKNGFRFLDTESRGAKNQSSFFAHRKFRVKESVLVLCSRKIRVKEPQLISFTLLLGTQRMRADSLLLTFPGRGMRPDSLLLTFPGRRMRTESSIPD